MKKKKNNPVKFLHVVVLTGAGEGKLIKITSIQNNTNNNSKSSTAATLKARANQPRTSTPSTQWIPPFSKVNMVIKQLQISRG